jgi:enamine deaminase RidA (YjgF/YER057c/UK114 family)
MVNTEGRLTKAAIELPPAVTPFGPYVPAVQTGNLLFLSGMLPTVGRKPKFLGRVGKELNIEQGRKAAYTAALNVPAVARQHLWSLDKVSGVVRLGVYVATAGEQVDLVKVADGASDLLHDIFGKDKMSARLVFGVESLPLGTPVELEAIFEVSAEAKQRISGLYERAADWEGESKAAERKGLTAVAGATRASLRRLSAPHTVVESLFHRHRPPARSTWCVRSPSAWRLPG